LTIVARGGIRQQFSWLGGIAQNGGKMLPEAYFRARRRALVCERNRTALCTKWGAAAAALARLERAGYMCAKGAAP